MTVDYRDPSKIVYDRNIIAPNIVKNVFGQGRAPLATDDSSEGFVVGSTWGYGADTWKCTDSTIGAAVWTQAGSGGVTDLQGAYNGGGTIITSGGNAFDISGSETISLFGAGSVMGSTLDSPQALGLVAVGGTSAGIGILNQTGTAADSVLIGSTAGGINFVATKTIVGSADENIRFTSILDGPAAISLIANGGASSTLDLRNYTGTGTESIVIESTSGGIKLDAGGIADIDSAGRMYIDSATHMDITAQEYLTIRQGDSESLWLGQSNTSNASSIDMVAGTTGMFLRSGGDTSISADEHVSIISGLDSDNAVIVKAQGGTGAGLIIQNTTGTIDEAISIEASLGGIDVDCGTGFALDVSSGGVDVNTTGSITLDVVSGTNGIVLGTRAGGYVGINANGQANSTTIGTSNSTDCGINGERIALNAAHGSLVFGAGGGVVLSNDTIDDFLIGNTGRIRMACGDDIVLVDGYRSGSTWGTELQLSSATAEWDLYETNFGEVSLLNAINQAAGGGGGTVTLQDAYDDGTGNIALASGKGFDITNNASGGGAFTVDWNIGGTNTHLYLAQNSSDGMGFNGLFHGVNFISDANGPAFLISNQSATSKLVLSSAGAYDDGIVISASAGGIDVDSTTLVSIAADAGGSLTLDNSAGLTTLTNDANGVIISNTGGALLLNSSGGPLTLNSDSAPLNITGGSGGIIATSDGGPSTYTSATTGDAQDLTLQVTGATDSSVAILSSGTGSDAIALSTSVGGIAVTAADSLYLASDASNITLGDSDEDSSIYLGGSAGKLTIHTSAGGGAGTDNGDIEINSSNSQHGKLSLYAGSSGMVIDSGTTMDFNATGQMTFTDTDTGPHTLADLASGGSSAWTDIENLDIDTGTEDIDSFAVTSDGMAVWEVFVGSGGNMRQHTFKAVWDYSANDVTAQSDDSTIDLGDTTDLTLTVTMSGGTIKLEATAASDNWIVKGKRMSVTL